jgi:hypothetical protein
MISSGKASAGESDKKSIASNEFLSAEAIDDEYHSPPAEPPIDTHFKHRMGSKQRDGPGSFMNQNSKRSGFNGEVRTIVPHSNFVLTDNSLILKAINMNKMQHQYI